MKQRMLAALMSLCLLVGLLSTIGWASDEPSRYVALGDSITTGYKPGTGSSASAGTVDCPFAQQLASTLGYELNNQAENGETSATLLAKLQGNAIDLSGAELITLSIGGNDLMEALYEYLSVRHNEASSVPMTPEEMKAMLMSGTANPMILLTLMGYLPEFAASQPAQNALHSFSQNLASIFQLIQTQNPNATIIIANQYNPYGHLTTESTAGIVQAFDVGVQALNTTIFSVARLNGVTMADVYTTFDQSKAALCNAYFTMEGFSVDFSLDFHPNQAGHEQIAQTLLDVVAPTEAESSTITTQPQSGCYLHSLTHHDAETATCVDAGNMEYWMCEICGKCFLDANGMKEVSLSDTVLPAIGHSQTEIKNAKEATCTQEGYTGDQVCIVCGTVVEQGTAIPKLSHTDPDGVCTVCGSANLDWQPSTATSSGSTWVKGSKQGLCFISAAAYSKFQKVQVDGTDLDPSLYEVKGGSTVVTLKASYLDTLSVGTHTLSIVSNTGTANAEFVIQGSNNMVPSPQTGDGSHLILWLGMAGLSGILLIVTLGLSGKHSFTLCS